MNNDKPPSEQETSSRPLAWGVVLVGGLLAVVLRVVPHPTSFSSVGAVSLFGGARVRGWKAYLIPLAVMIVSDLVLWVLSGFDFNYSLGHPSRFFVYGSFMIYVWIGRWLFDKNSILAVALAGTLGGLQFFIVTNFCTWLFQPLYYEMVPEAFRYTRDLDGLIQCFVAALPFYRGDTPLMQHPFVLLSDFNFIIVWTILGDILFTSIYLLAHGKLVQRMAQPEQTPVAAPSA